VVSASVVSAQHDMSQMSMSTAKLVTPLGISLSRMGSGTSWLPDSSPTRMIDGNVGAWLLMFHGQAFGQYDNQSTIHGGTQWGMIDWEMLTALRDVGGGLVRLNLMTSLERATLGASGYPELLQTGGIDHHQRIPNRQHPHNPIGELSVGYDHPITSNLATSIYLAPVGEPALGPVAYMHRPSGDVDPFAPIGHHWQDGSHESAGVISAALYSRAMKLEGSVFNGRDADSYFFNPRYVGARLDSYSGRLSVAATGRLTLAAWAGYLADHDPLEPGVSMQRYGASAIATTRGIAGGSMSTTFVWGVNNHHHNPAEHQHDSTTVEPLHHMSTSGLVETTLGLGTRASAYVRLEQVEKSGYDLGFLTLDLTTMYTVREAAIGGAYDLLQIKSGVLGVGARASVDLLPNTLRLTYQTTHPTGFAVYLRLRPALMSMPSRGTPVSQGT
jgi:hypothetical protein